MLETHLIKKKHLFRNPHKIYALCRQYPEKCTADGLIFLSKSQLPRIGAFAVQVNITQHLWWHFSVSNSISECAKGFCSSCSQKRKFTAFHTFFVSPWEYHHNQQLHNFPSFSSWVRNNTEKMVRSPNSLH